MAQRNCRIKQCLLFAIFSFFAVPALAQETPEWEFFGGYSMQWTNVREYYKSTPIIYATRNRYENLNGWDLAVTENRNARFGGTLEVSGHYKTPQRSGINNRERIHSIVYGPRFMFGKNAYVPF